MTSQIYLAGFLKDSRTWAWRNFREIAETLSSKNTMTRWQGHEKIDRNHRPNLSWDWFHAQNHRSGAWRAHLALKSSLLILVFAWTAEDTRKIMNSCLVGIWLVLVGHCSTLSTSQNRNSYPISVDIVQGALYSCEIANGDYWHLFLLWFHSRCLSKCSVGVTVCHSTLLIISTLRDAALRLLPWQAPNSTWERTNTSVQWW